ncbi:MAG: PKD domain-containing protein, partial [Candidatus Omnitrophota bacterium]
YHEYIGVEDSDYLDFAKKLGDWIYAKSKSDNGAGGYNMARTGKELDPDPSDPVDYDKKSTENNIDVYVAFMKLYEALSDPIVEPYKYRQRALYAKNFVLAMWDESYGMFWTGTLDDGVTINGGADSDVTGYDGVVPTSGQPQDPTTWGFMALGEVNKYGGGMAWVEDNCRVDNIDGFTFGYDFNADRDGIWFEGSAHIALAHQMLNDDTKSDSILDVIMTSQHASTGGIQCASHNGVTTSFNLWTLSTDLHISSAAWFILAVDKHNPFWGQAITDPIPYEGGYDPDTGQYIFNEPWVEVFEPVIEQAQDGTSRAMVEFDGVGADDKGYLDVADGYGIVKYEWDFDGKGTYDWSSSIDDADWGGNVRYWYTEVGVHLARFRVTNNKGYTSTRGVAITIDKEDDLGGFNPPTASPPGASLTSGEAPLTVTFTGEGSDPDVNGYIASYQWDFDGNGEYEYYSTSSGDATYVYKEAGTYQPTFKVTDKEGLTDTAVRVIKVFENTNGPTARARANGADATVGVAPYSVTFSADSSSGDINKYEWDFEDDGNWVSASTYTYGEAGTYRAKLRVTDTNGISDTDTVAVRVEYNTLLPAPEAVGSVEPSNGVIPFDTTFRHFSSAGSITMYKWDFDGNKNFDRFSSSVDEVNNTYFRPGYYLAILKVRDENGLTDRGYVPIVVAGPDQSGGVYSSYIVTPRDKERIYGNSVTVSINIVPDSRKQSVKLEYRSTVNPSDEGSSPVVSYPYRTTINATSLTEGDNYELGAPVNEIADGVNESTVTIDSNNWDIRENLNANNERIKEVKVYNNRDLRAELLDGTECEIKAGTLGTSDTLTDILTIKVPNSSGVLINDGTNSILYHREFSLTKTTSLNKDVGDIMITIPYNANNNGIVNGLNVHEDNLEVFIYDEDAEEWKSLGKATSYNDDENTVSIKVDHLSIFGLGPGAAAAGGGDGDDGGGGGGGRSCFIATATYGTAMAEEVQSLRFFRDTYLLTNGPGNFVIDMYEKYSPPIAKRIETNSFLKGMVRYHLRPIIKVSRYVNYIGEFGGGTSLSLRKMNDEKCPHKREREARHD